MEARSPSCVIDHELVAQAVAIEPTVLNEEFIRLPSDLAYWGGVYADAVAGVYLARARFDSAEAELLVQIKQAMVARAEKVTEVAAHSYLVQDSGYKVLREKVDQAEVLKIRASAVLEAIKAKRDMLISLGANMRAEMSMTHVGLRKPGA